MLSRPQNPTLRDFLLTHARTRAHLCTIHQIFDPCEQLTQLTSFEKATLLTWSIDSNVDRGLNLYILMHYLSAINNNSCYYHYVNNGNSDGTNMFGHVIGTSGSGKSSALTLHLDALGRTLTQMDTNEESVQHPNEEDDVSFQQPFIISNATALSIYRSLIYSNRLLCSTECDTLLTNLGVYGNINKDPRFIENVNMLIQMFDGTKYQNRSTLTTSYTIPEGRRASIIGASVGDPYARVSQQHYEGNNISGAHNRFTHYPCPVMKAIKTNSGSAGVISNMVPSLQHIYTVSILLGKVEYVPRKNVYDKSERKEINISNSDVEEKWNRLRPMANRHYCYSPAQIEIEFEELEADATPEHSKSAFYYMFNRVYDQWEEATLPEQEEHEAIIGLKNSTKIPRFICNFARFRTIMNILWHDSVYPLIEISEVMKQPYRVSNAFIEAVKNIVDKLFPSSLRKNDGTKILIIEKDTAIMGDLFFAHVDQVSRQLFDLSQIQEKFNSSLMMSRLLTKHRSMQEIADNTICADAAIIISSKFVFFSTSSFNSHRQLHNRKHRLAIIFKYLLDNQLIYQAADNARFIKGAHTSYAMLPPNQIKNNSLSIKALANLNLNITDYEQIWRQCLLPIPELSRKIEKPATDYIKLHLTDYISIIHRLGNANDPIAQEILKPGLRNGQIGIDLDSNTFSLASEHIVHFNNDDDVMEQLNKLCIRAIDQKSGLSNSIGSVMIVGHSLNANMSSSNKQTIQSINDYDGLQTEQVSSIISIDTSSNEYNQMNTIQKTVVSTEQTDPVLITPNIDSNSIVDCVLLSEEITEKNANISTINIQDDITSIVQCSNNNEENLKSATNIDDLAQTSSNDTLSDETLKTIATNNHETTDSSSAIEYDDPTIDSMTMDDVNHGLYNEQQLHKEQCSTSSSPTIIEYSNNKEKKDVDSSSMETDCNSNFQTTSSTETMLPAYENTSEDLQQILIEKNIHPEKSFDIITLSKKLMLKPFITFTKTDATRLYNSAEAKNAVIKYLQENRFINQIDDLFLSTNPIKRTFKPEIGYLKLFPVSQTASDTALFETKLREKVGITFDDYISKVFNGRNLSTSPSVTNNTFNTTYHNWLFNRYWYEKLKEGYFSVYHQNNIICSDTHMSSIMVPVAAVSSDNVHDSFDQPRPKLTASQRTNKELKRLGAKRQQESDDQPLPKRKRKPRRFVDDD